MRNFWLQFELFLGITLMSTSGAFSKLISLPAPVIIWLRCAIAVIPFFLILKFFRSNLHLKPNQYLPVVLGGLLMGAHWVTYFYALEYSTVAIGMLSLFTYPVFIIILEPLILKKRLKPRHIPISLIAFTGIYFLVPEFSISNSYTVGILFGLSSAVVYALRNIVAKKYADIIPGESLMFYQVLIMAVCLIPVVFLFEFNFIDAITENFLGLFLLAFITTVAGHTFFVRSFRHFSVSSIGIVSNMTPLIGIILAWIIIQELPTGNVYLGGGIILSTIFIEGFFGSRDWNSN